MSTFYYIWALTLGCDFKIARFSDEKIGGKSLTLQKLKDFNDCIQQCSLVDIKSIGSKWTCIIRLLAKRGNLED